MCDFLITTGTRKDHVIAIQGHRLTQDTAEALCELQAEAAKEGFKLAIASGFRDFKRQLQIWNDKASGKRPVLDNNGRPMPIDQMSEESLMHAILRWSALPGASRHHWGTDVDVFDEAAIEPNYRVRLTCEETQKGGIFFPMHRWLDSYLAQSDSIFFRPYSSQSFGIAPEPWHLSYAPQAGLFQRAQSPDTLAEFLVNQPILLKETILEHIENIFSRYIAVDWTLYPAKYRVSE